MAKQVFLSAVEVIRQCIEQKVLRLHYPDATNMELPPYQTRKIVVGGVGYLIWVTDDGDFGVSAKPLHWKKPKSIGYIKSDIVLAMLREPTYMDAFHACHYALRPSGLIWTMNDVIAGLEKVQHKFSNPLQSFINISEMNDESYFTVNIRFPNCGSVMSFEARLHHKNLRELHISNTSQGPGGTVMHNVPVSDLHLIYKSFMDQLRNIRL